MFHNSFFFYLFFFNFAKFIVFIPKWHSVAHGTASARLLCSRTPLLRFKGRSLLTRGARGFSSGGCRRAIRHAGTSGSPSGTHLQRNQRTRRAALQFEGKPLILGRASEETIFRRASPAALLLLFPRSPPRARAPQLRREDGSASNGPEHQAALERTGGRSNHGNSGGTVTHRRGTVQLFFVAWKRKTIQLAEKLLRLSFETQPQTTTASSDGKTRATNSNGTMSTTDSKTKTSTGNSGAKTCSFVFFKKILLLTIP